MTTDSPDILTGGRWVRDGLIVRWVAESLPVLQCCGRPRRKRESIRRGLCSACYVRHRANGTIHLFERRRAA